MTTEEKFNAAVNVIRSLPKNGSYQPSNDMMLKFYGYFKQATNGKCTGPRPAFWDVIGRAKYDAWKKLGDMPNTDAMAKYVDELHTIVETMSYSDSVASFLDAPSTELDSLNIEDLQLVLGDVIERVKSQPNSPLASREASPNRLLSSLGSTRSNTPIINDESDHSDGEYVDTIESVEPRSKLIPNGHIPGIGEPLSNGYGHKSRPRIRTTSHSLDISQEVAKAVQSLKTDIEKLTNKINKLEKNRNNTSIVKRTKLPFGISPQFLLFIITWPFITNFIINRFIKKRNL